MPAATAVAAARQPDTALLTPYIGSFVPTGVPTGVPMGSRVLWTRASSDDSCGPRGRRHIGEQYLDLCSGHRNVWPLKIDDLGEFRPRTLNGQGYGGAP